MQQSASPPPPPRPPLWEERLGGFFLRALGPRIVRDGLPATPPELAPFAEIAIPRPAGRLGTLAGTWFPPPGELRGGVLLCHPWMSWGRTYFFRRGRIEALRAAGYAVLTFDLPGFGESGPPFGFYDLDVEAALTALHERVGPGLPLHVWGVSSGGYWAHPVLARTGLVESAFFEDVSHHLLRWSWRMAPWGRPFYLVFRATLPRAHRFLDIARHGAAASLRAATYVSGETDPGVHPEDTKRLAQAAQGEAWIVPGAGHLGSIKMVNRQILERAVGVFRETELTGRAS